MKIQVLLGRGDQGISAVPSLDRSILLTNIFAVLNVELYM
jgi:hypothetical protein